MSSALGKLSGGDSAYKISSRALELSLHVGLLAVSQRSFTSSRSENLHHDVDGRDLKMSDNYVQFRECQDRTPPTCPLSFSFLEASVSTRSALAIRTCWDVLGLESMIAFCVLLPKLLVLALGVLDASLTRVSSPHPLPPWEIQPYGLVHLSSLKGVPLLCLLNHHNIRTRLERLQRRVLDILLVVVWRRVYRRVSRAKR